MSDDTKICAACGRRTASRRKWRVEWDEVRYCSRRCRQGSRKQERALDAALLSLLDERGDGATICPSEVARRVAPDAWRALMEPVRQAARRIAHAGTIVITQKGRVVDPADFRGPIRLRRP